MDEIDIHTKYPGISGKKIYSQISKSNIGKKNRFKKKKYFQLLIINFR